MPGTLTIDTGATFQAVLLMASGPKLKFGSTEQDINARGERKWDVQAAVTYHAEPGMKPVSEVIGVTVTGPAADPCATIPPGTPIVFDKMRVGFSPPEARGGQRIDRLLPEQLEDGYAEMRARGLAASSIRKVHAILSSAYEIEVRRGNVARNPCKLVEPPRLGQPNKTGLTQQQARAVLNVVAGRRNSARWSVGLACGLRQGEALGLRWPYVNLDSGELRVWFQLQRLPWRHGCTDIAACTEHRHRRPCPCRCPKALRKSGRPHVCIPASDPRICPANCTGHAAACPERQGGGLVFREIKERRRKTVALPPELVAILKAQREAQDLERETAANSGTTTTWSLPAKTAS